MKIWLIGEAANHREELLAQMAVPASVGTLPASAAHTDEFDGEIASDDVVVSLRFRRDGGNVPVFRMLHVPGAGLDGIDRASLPAGCLLCNVYEHQIPIAEYALSAMLEWEIRMSEMRARFRAEEWRIAYTSRVPHGELHGKTLGLLGFGGIGRAIAQRAKAFGMRVLAVDKYPQNAATAENLADSLLPNEEVDRILAAADYVIVSCPLTDETCGWIDAEKLGTMKESAVIINISRGEIVEQKDLYDALLRRRIGGAVLDVWWHYPAGADDRVEPADYPFHELENVVCTPHSCAWTKELTWRRYGVIAQNVENLRDGRPLRNVVA